MTWWNETGTHWGWGGCLLATLMLLAFWGAVIAALTALLGTSRAHPRQRTSQRTRSLIARRDRLASPFRLRPRRLHRRNAHDRSARRHDDVDQTQHSSRPPSPAAPPWRPAESRRAQPLPRIRSPPPKLRGRTPGAPSPPR